MVQCEDVFPISQKVGQEIMYTFPANYGSDMREKITMRNQYVKQWVLI
jgi:hypothetical protein